jgi:hypothetical protein
VFPFDSPKVRKTFFIKKTLRQDACPRKIVHIPTNSHNDPLSNDTLLIAKSLVASATIVTVATTTFTAPPLPPLPPATSINHALPN